MPDKKIGDLLVEKNLISKDMLSFIQDAQQDTEGKFEYLFVKRDHLHYLNETELIQLMGKFFNVQIVGPDDLILSSEAQSLIPDALAWKHGLIPIRFWNNETELLVACTAPIPDDVKKNLSDISFKTIRPLLMDRESFSQIFTRAYPNKEMSEIFTVESNDESKAVELTNKIILDAINRRATDIHLEPTNQNAHVRFRIDGFLSPQGEIAREDYPSVVSRIKVLSTMDITNKLIPQEGAFVYTLEELNKPPLNIRASTLPGPYGEKTVLRLLPPEEELISIHKLGIPQTTLDQLHDILNTPHGVILTTGPAASGKTTTLYSILNTIRNDNINISTIEDPIELIMEGLNQFQIDPVQNLSFPKVFKSLLRQDPDIIMLGEIRDPETAHLALHAGLTGHLILSTLHTNDTPSALIRLIDMGCEPYLVASSIQAIIAQRLIRLICPHCKNQRPIQDDELEILSTTRDEISTVTYGQGCKNCNGTGFRGRTGIFELLINDHELHRLIVKGANPVAINDFIDKKGIITLQQDGINKVKQGLTTPQEIARTTLV